MASLIIGDEIVGNFYELKSQKLYACILLGLSSDNSRLEVEGLLDRTHDFDGMVSSHELPDNDVKFMIWDFEYETDENPPRKTSKLVLISWFPDSAPVRRKMPSAQGLNDLAQSLAGIQKKIRLTDLQGVSLTTAIRQELLKLEW